MESVEKLSPIAFAERSAASLSRLYEAGLGLPEVSVVGEGIVGDYVSLEQAAGVSRRVQDKFGRLSVYSLVYHPFEEEEPVASLLWDDFANIYEDPKNGLVVFDRGSEHVTF